MVAAQAIVGWAVPTNSSAGIDGAAWWVAHPTDAAGGGRDRGLRSDFAQSVGAGDDGDAGGFPGGAALWCLARFNAQRSWFNAGLAGGAMGLAVLCRPTFLPWLGVVAVGMLLVRGGRERERGGEGERLVGDVAWRFVNCVALVGVAAIVVSPWVIRNQRVFGKPIVTTTHGGYTLLLGNNPSFYEWLRIDTLWIALDAVEREEFPIGTRSSNIQVCESILCQVRQQGNRTEDES